MGLRQLSENLGAKLHAPKQQYGSAWLESEAMKSPV